MSIRLPGCTQACVLQGLAFGGPGATSEAMHGSLAVTSFTMDGHPVPGALTLPWRTTSPGSRKIGCGFMPRATPGGVPVAITSPACRVMKWLT